MVVGGRRKKVVRRGRGKESGWDNKEEATG
jgi:hypothetical protein